jgi:hypothetical protein
MPSIPSDAEPYFIACMVLFVIAFFVGVHWRMHVIQHLIPPFYVLWLTEKAKRLLSKLQ